MSILEQESPPGAPKSAGERPGVLLAIAMIAAISYWVVAPAVYMSLAHGRVAPATQSGDIASQLSPQDLAALSAAAPTAGLLALLIANVVARDRPFERTGISFRKLRGGWWRGAIAVVIILPMMFVSIFLTEKFWSLLHYAHPMEHDLLRALGEEPSKLAKGTIIVSAVLLAPLFEEFFFRGMMQSAFKMMLQPTSLSPGGRRWLAIFVASLAFTAVHGAVWLAPPIFFLSLCLGYAYDLTGNLWVTIIVHGSFNAASVVMFLFLR
jgi:membrane protease YdiL (CAAX protease family)